MKIKNNDHSPICSICGLAYQRLNNNSWPINTGKCCDNCDALVLRARINYHKRGITKPQWFIDLADEVHKHGQFL